MTRFSIDPRSGEISETVPIRVSDVKEMNAQTERLAEENKVLRQALEDIEAYCQGPTDGGDGCLVARREDDESFERIRARAALRKATPVTTTKESAGG